MELPESVTAPLEFSLRVVASGVMFALIAGVAACLHAYITFLEARNLLSSEFLLILKWLEYAILVYDIICFSSFLIAEGLLFTKELLRRVYAAK